MRLYHIYSLLWVFSIYIHSMSIFFLAIFKFAYISFILKFYSYFFYELILEWVIYIYVVQNLKNKKKHRVNGMFSLHLTPQRSY